MSFLGWLALGGGVLLLMALSSAYLQKLPLSVSTIYLAIGLALGPAGFGLLHVDLEAQSAWLERLTEAAVILSLFIGGLKLRLPVRHVAWRAAFWLAGPVMIVCIAGVAVGAHYALGLSVAAALLLGAMLAPTDPVLAGLVTVNDASDHDRVRYGLSGEAGLNDGAAFPFVVLALGIAAGHTSGGDFAQWALHRIVYAVPAALALGFFLGRALGRFAIFLRSHHRDADGPNDFLALALIALAYVAAETIGAWGFLAVFASGVGFRAAEICVVSESPHPDAAKAETAAEGTMAAPGGDVATAHPPAETLVDLGNLDADALRQPAVAAGAVVGEMLSFGATAERLLEVLLVVLVGVALATHWDARALLVAAALFLVIRPLATTTLLRAAPGTARERWLMGWFGIRGIGSLYYLCYALQHGYDGAEASLVVDLTLSVVALSIVVHGVTSNFTPREPAPQRPG